MSVPQVLPVRVPALARDYQVRVGPGVLAEAGARVRACVPSAGHAFVVTDDNVEPLHGPALRASLRAAGLTHTWHVIPAGEASKTPAHLLQVLAAMADAGVGRDDVVVALGGGVVGDLAGLAAALFMRGLALVQCPTSLLAQVDASVGGKTAVDLPAGKNLMGAFHFPREVLIDTTLLATLPERELRCGLAEMLKHGLLFDGAHVAALEAAAGAIVRREAPVLSALVAESVALKAACVAGDAFERATGGRRALLNLGHTVGHALESASGYELLHGEAVALGLRAAARVSDALGLSCGDLERTVTATLGRLSLLLDLDGWLARVPEAELLAFLQADKKRARGTVTYIGLRGVGKPQIVTLAPRKILHLLRLRAGPC